MSYRNILEDVAKYIPIYWLFVGLFTAVLKYFGYASISPESLLALFSLILMICINLHYVWYLVLTIILIGLALLKLIFINDVLIGASFRAACTWCFLFLYACYCSKRVMDEKAVSIILKKAVPLLLFVAVLQVFFFENLPDAFVNIPTINEDFMLTNYEKKLSSMSFVQPNGLYANPIVFSTTMAFFFGVLLHFKPRGYKISCTLIALIILVSLSRFAIGAFGVILVANFYKNWKAISILFCLLLFLNFTFIRESSDLLEIIHNRFILQDVYALSSNIERASDLNKAFDQFIVNPIFGIGFYEYAYRDIITDGALVIMLLEVGFVVTLLTVFIIIHRIVMIYKKNALYSFAMGVIFFSCLINSALINTSTAVIFIYFLFSIQNFKNGCISHNL